FDLSFLENLRSLHLELENNVPYLDDVQSLINVTSIRGEEGELIVEELLEQWPENQKALELIKQRVMADPIYRNTLISEDGTYTTLLVRSDPYGDESETPLNETTVRLM
ncbi:MAG: RND transporter, partial [SAR324 cluster bacterium]